MGWIGRGGDRSWFARACALVMALLLFFGWPFHTAAYLVLSHEAIIDSVWETNIRPLLLKDFPEAMVRIRGTYPLSIKNMRRFSVKCSDWCHASI
jgi:hypothetical protein